jgi:hypothetical protein
MGFRSFVKSSYLPSPQALQNFMGEKALGLGIYGHFISFLFIIYIYLAQMEEFIAKRKKRHFISLVKIHNSGSMISCCHWNLFGTHLSMLFSV